VIPGLLRLRLRAPRFGGLKPAVARRASEGGSLAMMAYVTDPTLVVVGNLAMHT
jgi:hypothetical protein